MSSSLKNLQLFLVISIIMCVTNCREKDPKQENLGLLSLGEAKDYLLFKPGSWWVYKNSFTNEVDTMILYFCYLDTFHAESTLRKFDYEDMAYGFNSIRDKAVYNSFSHGLNAERSNFYTRWGWECERKNGFNPFSGISTQFFYPFDKKEIHSNGSYTTNFIELKDSMVIKGNSYYGVAVFSVLQDRAFPYPNISVQDNGNSMYYWARNVGIIKIEHSCYDEQGINKIKMNWELLESHIYK